MNFVIVLITAATKDEAEKIAATLVKNKLAACANVIPQISSTFWWQGKVEKSEEALLLVKTTENLVDELTATVKEVHSYKVPEIIVIPVARGDPTYLNWVKESVRE